METFLWVTAAILSAIPVVIAEKRKCRNLSSIYFLSFFLSWTVIGWVAAMAWAIGGEPDQGKVAKAASEVSS